MKNKKRLAEIGLVTGLIIFLTGCATTLPPSEVFRDKTDINTRTFDFPMEKCWQAVKEAALNDGFCITAENSSSGTIETSKYFQKGSKTITITLQAHLQPLEDSKTKIYINAFQTTEALYKSHTTTHLIIIPIPSGTQASKVKEEQRTIEDKKFYDAFFKQIEISLKAQIKK